MKIAKNHGNELKSWLFIIWGKKKKNYTLFTQNITHSINYRVTANLRQIATKLMWHVTVRKTFEIVA